MLPRHDRHNFRSGQMGRGGGRRAGGQCPALLLACPDSVPVPNYCFWDRFFGTDFLGLIFLGTDCFGTKFFGTDLFGPIVLGLIFYGPFFGGPIFWGTNNLRLIFWDQFFGTKFKGKLFLLLTKSMLVRIIDSSA